MSDQSLLIQGRGLKDIERGHQKFGYQKEITKIKSQKVGLFTIA